MKLKKETKEITRCLMVLTALAMVLNIGLAYGDYDPHPDDINYDERYRPQYHFSPKTEWMNDINGLWYLDGKYTNGAKRSDMAAMLPVLICCIGPIRVWR